MQNCLSVARWKVYWGVCWLEVQILLVDEVEFVEVVAKYLSDLQLSFPHQLIILYSTIFF